MKKFISLVIVFSLILNMLSLPLFAATNDNLSEKEQALLLISKQLKEQNMLEHYELYKEIIEKQYPTENKYSLFSLRGSSPMKLIRAVEGGAVEFKKIQDHTGFKTTILYFDKEDSEPFREGGIGGLAVAGLFSGGGLFVTNVLASGLLGVIGFVAALEAAHTMAAQGMIINSPNKCAMVIALETSYGRSTVVTAWSNYPYVSVPWDRNLYYDINYILN